MKIVIAGSAYPFRGGLAAFNERLARQFIAEGHDTGIITFTLQYPSLLFPGRSQYLDGEAPQGLRITPMMSSVNPLSWIRTGRMIRKLAPDILIFKYWLPFMAPCFGTIARIAKRNRQTKVFCILDNVIPHEPRCGDRLLTAYFLRSLDAAVAMSDKVRNDFLAFRLPAPVSLSPHPLFDNFGVAPEREKAAMALGLDPGCRYILFFGFIRHYKGLDLLLDAFSRLKGVKEKRIKLLVAGEFYEDKVPYMKIISEKGTGDDIIMFDRFINDHEVALFFGLADLVVQPYRNATQSGVTQIAYHFGTPMLVTDVGGLREIVPDGVSGFVVKPDPAEIAIAIDRFFADESLQLRLRKGVEEERRRYGWDRMTAAIYDMYKQMENHDNQK